jgi:NHL repeat-containing protein
MLRMRSLVIAVMLLGCGRIDFDGLGDDGAPSDGAPPISLELLAGDIGGLGNVDGTGAAARFDSPTGVAVDSAGNIYVADRANETIRKITPDGVVTTLAGTAGVSGSADGTGAAARFDSPAGVAVDSAGYLYVADATNATIRKITPGGVVTTLAGTAGVSGSADGTGPAARFNSPAGVAVDSSGNVYVADSGNDTIRKVTPSGVVATLAGTPGASGKVDGTGPTARFWSPASVAVDSGGNVYVADEFNSFIRKITPEGVVSTLTGTSAFPSGVAVDSAGNIYFSVYFFIQKFTPAGMMMTTLAGTYGDGIADGTGATASFRRPSGVAVDGTGNVYVADFGNDTIRKVTPSGVVTTLAGRASASGSADGTSTAASFFRPSGVTVDGAGNVYVADQANDTIRKVTLGGVVTTLAGTAGMFGSADGTGAVARFGEPAGVAVDSAGNVYVADQYNDNLRKATPDGMVTTLAGTAGVLGSADGTGPVAQFDSPTGVAVDSAGNIYVTDQANHTIRKVNAAGVVTTLAGTAGVSGSADGTGPAARFDAPAGVAVDSAGNVYVADQANETIRKITPDGVVTTLAGTAGVSGSADGTGPAARFDAPAGVAVDSAGNIYVTDELNRTIRKITATGVVTTIAGSPGVAGILLGTTPRLALPQGLAIVGDSIVIADINAILLLRHGVR